jgi:hypothetical protein
MKNDNTASSAGALVHDAAFFLSAIYKTLHKTIISKSVLIINIYSVSFLIVFTSNQLCPGLRGI